MSLPVSAAALLPKAAELARLHAAELPQKDELCGCFCTLLTLRLAGVEPAEGPLDQDALGLAAGSMLGPEGHHDEELPPGEPGRRDYRLDLPRSDDLRRVGTNAPGLVRAVDELSGGARVALPVLGPWSGETVQALLALAAAEADAQVVLNVATRFLWGSR